MEVTDEVAHYICVVELTHDILHNYCDLGGAVLFF